MNNIFTTLLYQMEKHHDTVLCTIIADGNFRLILPIINTGCNNRSRGF